MTNFSFNRLIAVLGGCLMISAVQVEAASPYTDKVAAAEQSRNQSAVVTLGSDNFAKEVEKSSQPVCVDAFATWCGPCKRMAPFIDQLSAELAGKVKFGKFDVDAQKDLAKRFRIKRMPTLMLFRDGRLVGRHEGSMDKAGLEKWIQGNLG